MQNTPTIKSNSNNKYNISLAEKNAIKSLANDQSIIIKEADKGGAVVIMDREHYKEKVENMLSDKKYYEKLDTDPQKTDRIKYNKFIKNYKDNLTQKEIDYLSNFDRKPSNFYGLPKVHKSDEIRNACDQFDTHYVQVENVTNLKFRPIVAGPACQTHRLSNLIDILLRPLTKRVKSYLRDTTDFLNHLPSAVPENTLLASFDVESLYSNIPHELGIEAIKYWLRKYPNDTPSRFPKKFIIEGIEFILKNNTFCFNEKNYRQTKGTAMGTKFAPVYATLVIGYLEEKLYKQIHEKYGSQYAEEFIHNWKRFLDDCFIPWTKSKSDLLELNNLLNNLHPDIKFTMEYSNVQQPFLDVLVKRENTKIETDIYYKPTDSKQYLLFNSCHPKHTKTSIPFSLARRIRSIVTNEATLQKRMDELRIVLINQKYPKNVIDKGIQKAMNVTREDLRVVREKKIENLIPFVSTFNPKNPEMFNTIRQNLPILHEDETMKEIMQNYPIIKSKRQPWNLKKLLTRAKFAEIQESPKITKCNRPNCGVCDYLMTDNEFLFKCGKTFKVKTTMSCDAKNLIYVIKCKGCDEEYIGETGDTLRHRLTFHRQQIRDARVRILYVSNHIANCARFQPVKFSILPLYKMQTDCVSARKIKEKHFIGLFKPKLNKSI